MKIKLFYRTLLVILVSLFIFSCSSDNEEVLKPKPPPVKPPVINPPKKEKIYLVEFEKIKTTNASKISGVAKLLVAYGYTIPFINEIKNDVTTYVIKYNTTFQDKEVVASGLVLIPKGDKEFPLLSFQNGTNTEHSRAPSVDYNSNMFQLFNIMSATGFIVLVPDYLGFGASDNMYHPYLHKKSTTQSIVDMMKAVKELANGKKLATKSSKDVYLSGYSQGGWSTMCVQKSLELDYAEDFKVKASSCGAGPYNLETVIKTVLQKETYNNPFFLAYVFNTMYRMGQVSEETIGKVVNKPYSEKMLDLFDGKHSGGEINAKLSTKIATLFTENFIKNYATSEDFKEVRNFLQKNSVGFWKTEIPTKLFHGTADNDVPFATSQEAYNEMKKLGVTNVTLQLVPIANSDHQQAILPTEIATLQWFLELKK